ncbi:hypothetical protein LCGC14_0244800 [marine sediment metagenome]|uniref:Uncharacterized protein n=1 Tax=marine sediment metagenome TaxID=412755 RepID=A0A0F9XB45_9ZZZZ
MAEELIHGLQLLVEAGGKNFLCCAEHDVIYADARITPDSMEPSVVSALEKAGWGYGEHGWYHFV